MNILDFCDNGDILSIFRIIKIVILIIKIAVPIILIVTIMIDFMKCIQVGDDAELEKTFITSMKKFIAAALIFLVPTFVNLIITIAGMNGNELADCITEATSQKISNSYAIQADELLKNAEDNKSWNAYYSAQGAVSKIKDEDLLSKYNTRLSAVKTVLDSEIKSREELTNVPGNYFGSIEGDGVETGLSATNGNVTYDATTNTFYKSPGGSKGTGSYGLQTEFSRRLTNMINDAKKVGKTISISNGYRSYEYQKYLWNCLSTVDHRCNRNWVACPGSSNHNFGLAADLSGDLVWAAANASKYGLHFPLGNEDWHIEPINIVGFGNGDCTCTSGYYNGVSCSNASVPS